jgi:hypothetical protein
MPVHRILRADWDVEAARIARTGEKVTAILDVGADMLDIYTVPDPQEVVHYDPFGLLEGRGS